MNYPFKHSIIKEAITVCIIWITFQSTNLSFFISKAFGISQIKDFVTVSIFITLYKLSTYLYDKFLWKIFFRKFLISGSWVYALCGINSSIVIIGTFKIEQTSDSINIPYGTTWSLAESNEFSYKKRGDWYGKVVDWTGNNISIFFHMTSFVMGQNVEKFSEKLEGLFILSYPKSPIGELQGTFNGIGVQSERRGLVIMRKVTTENIEEIIQIGLDLSKQIKPNLTIPNI